MGLVDYDGSSSEEDQEAETVSSSCKVKDEQNCGSNSKDTVEADIKMRIPVSARLKTQALRDKLIKKRTVNPLLTIATAEELDSSESDDDNSSLSKTAKGKQFADKNKDLLSLLPPAQRAYEEVDRPKRSIIVPQQVKKFAQKKTELQSQVQADSTIENSELVDNDISSSEQKPEGGNFFSFYDARAEKERLEKIPEALPPSQKASVLLASAEGASSQREQSVASKFPAPQIVDPSATEYDRTQHMRADLKPGQKLLAEMSEDTARPTETVELEHWSEDTFIPGPERKRLMLASKTASSKVNIDTILQSGNVRDVRQHDLTEGAREELMKNVTADRNQYKAAPEFNPSKLAGKKHQITWLAQRAEAEEEELKDRWARSKQNQATNRAKYGF